MALTQTIAIIGATEDRGLAMAMTLSQGNYRLILFSNDPAKADAARLALVDSKAEIIWSDCAMEASWEADMIVIATAELSAKEIAGRIRDVAVGKTVVSLVNFSHPSSSDNSKELQTLLPYSSVVTAFPAAEENKSGIVVTETRIENRIINKL
jgi:hypothetical protein